MISRETLRGILGLVFGYVFEAIRKRCSVRSFLDMQIDEDVLLSVPVKN